MEPNQNQTTPTLTAPTTTPTTAPVQNAAPVTSPLVSTVSKSLKNVSRSAYILRFFLSAITLIALVYAIYKSEIGAAIFSLLVLAYYVVFSVLGRQLRKQIDFVEAKKRLTVLIILALVSVLWPIISALLTGSNGIITIVISAVLLVHLITARVLLKPSN